MYNSSTLCAIPLSENLPFYRYAFSVFDQQASPNAVLLAGFDPQLTERVLKKEFIETVKSIKTNTILKLSDDLHIRTLGKLNRISAACLNFKKDSYMLDVFSKRTKCNLLPLKAPLPVNSFHSELKLESKRYWSTEEATKQMNDFFRNNNISKDSAGTGEQETSDNEGFILVTKSKTKSKDGVTVKSFTSETPVNPYNPFIQHMSGTSEKKQANKKKRGGVETDFYRFQLQQQKEDAFNKLKDEYDKDIERIETFKQLKKFQV